MKQELSRRRRRRTPLLALAATALVLGATLAAASTPAGTQFLPGDTFEIDGNKPADAGGIDWLTPPPHLSTVSDPVKGDPAPDNSFGEGTKEDTAVPSVVAGSVPPMKSDFSQFQVAHRAAANGDTLLYLDWTRSNALGTADMDFELNQSSALSSNGVTPLRTQGDLLITYDFAKGGKDVSIHTATWNGNAISGSWSSPLTSLDHNQAVASISDSLLFGELAINLNAAGIFQTGSCESFSSAYLKSRSSDAFTSALKDFVAPASVSVTNCGHIKIIKRTDPRGADQNFSFTSSIPNPGTSTTPSCTSDTTPADFTLNDKGNTTSDSAGNTEDCTNVLAGTYAVTEVLPASWELENLSCDATGGGSGLQDGDNPARANITVVPDSVVTCVYVNKQSSGAIKITKTSSKGLHPALPGAVFSVTSGGTAITGSPFTTGADGTVCVDHLPLGTYSVQETTAPTGYGIDDTAAHDVTVDKKSTCGDGNEATFSATDTPLSNITVSFESQAPGVTKASISCGSLTATPEDTTPGVYDDSSETFENLAPGVYTCTVDIDP